MFQSDYQFWVNYKLGFINRELTKKELKEIRASEFAAELLVPTKSLIDDCNKYGGVEIALHSPNIMKELANIFEVDDEIICIRLQDVLNDEIKNGKKATKRIIKRIDNIIKVDFN